MYHRNKYVGVLHARKTGHWPSLARVWLKVLQKHYEVVGSEYSCEQYSERPLVGMLAVAAWRLGWIAIEEYAQSKRSHRRSGRADLWICRDPKDYGDQIEAKFSWRTVTGNTNNFASHARERVQAALTDAKAVTEFFDAHRVGLAFIAPRIFIGNPKTKEALRFQLQIINERIFDTCSALIAEKSKFDIAAGFFPDFDKSLQVAIKCYKTFGGYCYPGVFLVAKRPTAHT